MVAESNTATPDEPRKSQAMQDFEALIERLANEATAADREKIAELVDPNGTVRIDELTPAQAAVLYKDHQGHNRDFSLPKANYYAGAMTRGEWKLIHQGLAFYRDGKIADGQHRSAAVVISDTTQKFVMFPNFGDGDVDAIDVGKARSAGDAVQLLGFEEPRHKAGVSKVVMDYEHEVQNGRKLNPTVIQVERFVEANDEVIGEAVRMAKQISAKCAEPCLTLKQCAVAILLLLRGGYTTNLAGGFVSAVQLGIADSEGDPAAILGKKFLRAKHSERRVYRINQRDMLAMICKGASLHVQGKTVTESAVKWNPKREPLPAAQPPVLSDAAE
jgi:hypothetical protein